MDIIAVMNYVLKQEYIHLNKMILLKR